MNFSCQPRQPAKRSQLELGAQSEFYNHVFVGPSFTEQSNCYGTKMTGLDLLWRYRFDLQLFM
ncbi:hypothetical protein CEQ90_05210 [Lewinellaceae bacterium SD302]|nr:hypothetical protein CEQ90_05210 [Lewinellaceae bacterium SD302]